MKWAVEEIVDQSRCFFCKKQLPLRQGREIVFFLQRTKSRQNSGENMKKKRLVTAELQKMKNATF